MSPIPRAELPKRGQTGKNFWDQVTDQQCDPSPVIAPTRQGLDPALGSPVQMGLIHSRESCRGPRCCSEAGAQDRDTVGGRPVLSPGRESLSGTGDIMGKSGLRQGAGRAVELQLHYPVSQRMHPSIHPSQQSNVRGKQQPPQNPKAEAVPSASSLPAPCPNPCSVKGAADELEVPHDPQPLSTGHTTRCQAADPRVPSFN